MAYTFEQQQKRARIIVTALKGAKDFLRAPNEGFTKTDFVCCAVSAWYKSKGKGYHGNEAMMVREYISRAINHRSTFDNWLRTQGYPRYGRNHVQELRFAWIDKMIADLTETYKL